uniref:R-spondin 4 n=1 Tax=Anolis carolinensis TaxID=28377 RepID=H9GGW4_ANOCA|nr:PREDICTED: R-spondin-4 [Anolis carolinensis]|eukprot:XP_008117010.2 PREDICTED: R-spondin-4 [Anolis carolinensis]
MQWIVLFLLLWFINSMEMLTQARRRKQVSTTLFENCTGCIMCSEDNGCISCQQKLFLIIWRDGMRQYGACVHACPPGYFGVRGQEVNRCIKCRSPNCESCFSKDFCIKCKQQFYLHKGKCLSTCPLDTIAQPSTQECLSKPEKCEMGPWGNWSPCTNQGRTCGWRWGSAARSREAIKSSKEEAEACPVLTESRKCRMKKRCPGEKKGNKRKEKRERKQRRKKKLDALLAT